MSNRLIYILVLLTICTRGISQSRKIDFESSSQWSSLGSAVISENGDFVAYTVVNPTKTSMNVVVRSVDGNWSRSINCENRFFDAVITDKTAIFTKSTDTVVLVTLGKSVEYFSGFQSFKASRFNKHMFGISRHDTLIVLNGTKKSVFSCVTEYIFADASHVLLCRPSSDLSRLNQEIVNVDLNTGKQSVLWSGNRIQKLILSQNGSHIAFLSNGIKDALTADINIIDLSNNSAHSVSNVYDQLEVADIVGFNGDNDLLIVKLKVISQPINEPNPAAVKIWSYNQDKLTFDNSEFEESNDFFASVTLKDGCLRKLQERRDSWQLNPDVSKWRKNCLVYQTQGDCSFEEQYWNPACEKKWYSVDLATGVRTELSKLNGKSRNNQYFFSPNGKYVIYFDFDLLAYACYYIQDGKIVILNSEGHTPALDVVDSLGYLLPGQRGIAGWSSSGDTLYFYDRFDIWSCNLKKPESLICLTNNAGNNQGIVFTLLTEKDQPVDNSLEGSVVSAFDLDTKDNGFYRLSRKNGAVPTKLYMGKYLFYAPFNPSAHTNGMRPIKAPRANRYLVLRQSSESFPNFYFTERFADFRAMSNVEPQNDFNWYKTKLITWTLQDGKKLNGVLYVPGNFDTTKKYPVIFNVYETYSDGLNAYERPDPLCNSCSINPVQFVSKGYLVFQPDIVYKFNKSGESAVNSIQAAYEYLSKYSWIDTLRLGVQGCSFGGFETNYLISRLSIFKAACAASGSSELMSWASMRYRNVYTSFFFQQYRISTPFWQDPAPYVENSPLFKTANISTPLLIFHTTADSPVPFNQGMQLFLTLRRLNKPCWMLEYGGGANHGVHKRSQVMDFSYRMQQFFDHYLMEGPMPSWMKKPS